MKWILLLAATLAMPVFSHAQPDLTGAYGYSFAPQGNPPAAAKNKGPKGNLVLVKMQGNKYRFWLDVNLGWPNYHAGETDGTVEFRNDTASFDNTFEDASKPCIISFRIAGETIQLNSHSTSFNCGFGQGVNADGEYARLKEQPALNNDWLKKEYPQSPTATVTVNRAEIFQDENGLVPFSPKRYFVKGDKFLDISETEKTVYTEYIPSPGKFVWGWVNKRDVKLTPAP